MQVPKRSIGTCKTLLSNCFASCLIFLSHSFLSPSFFSFLPLLSLSHVRVKVILCANVDLQLQRHGRRRFTVRCFAQLPVLLERVLRQWLGGGRGRRHRISGVCVSQRDLLRALVPSSRAQRNRQQLGMVRSSDITAPPCTAKKKKEERRKKKEERRKKKQGTKKERRKSDSTQK